MTNNQEAEEEEVDSASGIIHGVAGGNESSDENNENELRSHIARLASELESLKTLIGAGATASSAAGSGSAIRNNKNNSANFRLH